MTAHPPVLRAEALSLGYDDRTIVEGLDLEVMPGKVTVIVGANACGKSTLLRGIARLMRPSAGAVTLDGDDIHRMPTRQVATRIGLLPQSPIAPDGITVRELVSRGRYPHQKLFRAWTTDDDRIVDRALSDTDTQGLAETDVDSLSGGQRQRVWVAMSLAQQPGILLLDEPTTFLDIAHALDVLDLVARVNREQGTTVAMVLHDLGLAARYADELVVMSAGRIIASGDPRTVLTPDTVRRAFGIEAVVVDDPVTGTPLVIPQRRRVV